MKTKRSLLSLLSLVMVASMVLAACAPAATPTAAPADPTTAPAEPTAAPAEPTAAPAEATAAPAEPTAAPAASGPTKGGTLTVAELGGYYTLDSFVTPWHAYPQYNVYDTILTLKPDLSGYIGLLVEDGWKVSDDNLTITFKVRDGIKFQDGEPVTASALKWDLDHATDPVVASPGGADLATVYASSEAPDESTLIIKLKEPYAPLLNQLANIEMPSPKAYQDLGPDKFAQAPVGAGAWKVKEIVPDNSITYVRNEDYAWGPSYLENRGAMYPDQLVLKYMGDEQVEFASLETGEIQILPSIPAQFLEQAKANPNIEIVKGQETGGTYLGFNTQFAPFDDPKVRVAISYAINRDELIEVGFSGEAVPMYSPLASSELGYTQEADDYGKSKSDDVETAKQMLADLGYKAGSDGILAKDGKKMEFVLTTTPDAPRPRIAETIQAQLQEIGIKVTIDLKETQVVKDMTVQGTHQIILWGFGLVDPNILTYLFSSERIGKSNRTRYGNPELDKMLKEADGALDWDVRVQKVTAVQKFLIDQRPSIPLFSQITNLGYRKDMVGGLKFDKIGNYILGDAYVIQ